MKLLNYWYECKNCATTFKSPEVSRYGEFLLRNQTGDIAYLNAINCNEFTEFSDLLKVDKLMTGRNENQRADILQNIFGLICDQSDKNNYYSITQDPRCSYCGEIKYGHWGPTSPPDIIDVDVKTLTFKKWNSLTDKEKKQLVNQTLQMYFNLQEDSENSKK